MRGDFSRQTFRPSSHYSAVFQQQGRVQLDADWNEQQLIHLHQIRSAHRDIIGPTGAPRDLPGFHVTPTGANLAISRGRYYVDGILCHNEQEGMLITEQPDLPGFTLPNADAVYLAYLHVWERHESAAERPDLRETALGGPDTTTRLRTVAQVRLLELSDTGTNATCEADLPEWNQLLEQWHPDPANAGRLQARTDQEGVTEDPACILPPSAGYKGLENQLYRVEIHTAGDRDTARFKWSRENGSIASPITSINGLVLTVETTGRDDKLAFVRNGWVEISDDSLELNGQRGQLFQVDDVDPATREITLQGGPLPSLDAQGHRLIRRWEQNGALSNSDGAPLNSSEWITLENGVQVRFAAGSYNVGDYWLIPARSATSVETGSVEWPVDAGQPAALLSQAPSHHFAKLGIFQRQAGNWTALAGADDCRIIFPPLTGITAEDVAFDNTVCNFNPSADTVQAALDELCRSRHCQCTLLIEPGDDVAAAFATLGANHNALVCLRVGHYALRETVTIRGAGHLRIVGAGIGTRLSVNGSECALRFENCASVTMEHLQIEGGETNQDELNGALTCIDCPEVTAEHCAFVTRGAGHRRATGLTIRNAFATEQNSVARIASCTFSVGHYQVGLLVVNIAELFVRDNVLRSGHRPRVERLLEDRRYRADMRRNFLASPSIEAAPDIPTRRSAVATMDLGNTTLNFRTSPTLTSSADRRNNVWTNALAPAERERLSPRDAYRRLERIADHALLRHRGDAIPAPIRNLARLALDQDLPAGLQGIVVGGRQARSIQIQNNRITHFVQGIHVGVSHRAAASANPDQSERVRITGNTIQLLIGSAASRSRHGIFVGNFHSLDIHQNHITALRPRINAHLATDAIRIYGWAGPRMSIKDNHTENLETMVSFHTLTGVDPDFPPFNPVFQWIIASNLGLDAESGVIAQYHRRGSIHDIRDHISRIDENMPS